MMTVRRLFVSLLLCGFVGLFSCKTPKLSHAIPVVITETEDATTKDTAVISSVSDSLEQADDWVDTPAKSGELQMQISNHIRSYRAFRNGFSGFELYDLSSDTVIFNMNEYKYFTSASNTKLFTLFACLKTCKDSCAAFKYIESDTSFTFWGTADPTLLHPYFEDSTIVHFLKRKTNRKKIHLANYNMLSPYGRGWMWDDYNDAYQTEITAMPLYGNVLSVKQEKNRMTMVPSSPMLSIDFSEKEPYIRRDRDSNRFVLPSALSSNSFFSQEVPYKYAAQVNLNLLGQVLGTRIDTGYQRLPLNYSTKYSWPVDTVLKRMMFKSDNMLAEHMLLNGAMQAIDTLNTAVFIKWIKDAYLNDLPQKVYWVDGSGLSRYNRCTPSSLVYLLNKLYKEEKTERLFSFFNEIKVNQSDSIKSKMSKSKIMAKSGSMTGVYNLSGYIITSKGRVLAFSFMNNNFDVPIRDVRVAVAKILNYIAESL